MMSIWKELIDEERKASYATRHQEVVNEGDVD